MGRGLVLGALALVLGLMLQFATAQAFDDTALASAEKAAATLRAGLAQAQSTIAQGYLSDDQLAAQRVALEQLRLDAAKESDKLAAPAKDVQQQLAQLGAAPAPGQTEADTIAAQRSSLKDAFGRFVAAQKQFELTGLEAEQTTAKVSAQQRELFFQRIFRADKSILNPELWRDTATGTGLLLDRLSAIISLWWQLQVPQTNWPGLALLPAFLVLVLIARRIVISRGWWPLARGIVPLSPLQRLWRVIAGATALALGLVALSIVVTTSFGLAGLATFNFQIVLDAVSGIFVATAFRSGLAWLICAPGNSGARLVAVDNRAARLIPAFILLTTFIHEFAAQIATVADQLLLPLRLVAGQSAIASALLILLASLLLPQLRKQAQTTPADVPEPHYLKWFVRFIPVIWLLLGLALLALLFGYLALSYYVSGKILETLLAVVLITLLHHLADAVADELNTARSPLGAWSRRVTGWSGTAMGRLAMLLRTAADVIIFVAGVPWLLALWAVTWINFAGLTTRSMAGFRLGGVTVAPVAIFSVLALLTVGIIVTRFLSRWLDRRVLAHTRLDKGVKNSIRTSSTYLGYVAAAALAFTAVGFDLSNIALVAGALGVGIGFGLQSIVNNIVSGLILLIERPLRAGDWIVTRAGEGIVKKINVRSTEIETFDHGSIIIPNSTLITEPLRNWTLRNTLGRFSVTVTVRDTADVAVVASILEEAARAHAKVMAEAPIVVLFNRFLPQGFEFEVSGQVEDALDATPVASDIRFAIAQQFKKRKIQFPTNQRDASST